MKHAEAPGFSWFYGQDAFGSLQQPRPAGGGPPGAPIELDQPHDAALEGEVRHDIVAGHEADIAVPGVHLQARRDVLWPGVAPLSGEVPVDRADAAGEEPHGVEQVGTGLHHLVAALAVLAAVLDGPQLPDPALLDQLLGLSELRAQGQLVG